MLTVILPIQLIQTEKLSVKEYKNWFAKNMQFWQIAYTDMVPAFMVNEPPHGKTNNLHRQKQRRRSASQ